MTARGSTTRARSSETAMDPEMEPARDRAMEPLLEPAMDPAIEPPMEPAMVSAKEPAIDADSRGSTSTTRSCMKLSR